MKQHFQRGQESAPFELLVAVTLMIFVVAAGLNAMNVLGKQQCIGQIDKRLEDMKTAIELVASGKGAANVDFRLPSCFKGSSVEITQGESSLAVCSRICGGIRRECTLLRFVSEDEPMAKCLNISPNTDFLYSAPCSDRSSENLELLKFAGNPGGIPSGYYSLIEVQDPFLDHPMICTYRRTR